MFKITLEIVRNVRDVRYCFVFVENVVILEKLGGYVLFYLGNWRINYII